MNVAAEVATSDRDRSSLRNRVTLVELTQVGFEPSEETLAKPGGASPDIGRANRQAGQDHQNGRLHEVPIVAGAATSR